MNMIYSKRMTKKYAGYEITEENIDSALRYLIHEKKQPNATREDAIKLLEEKMLPIAHLIAHKKVVDEK